MINEREILKVLSYVNSDGNNISQEYFGIEFVEFAKLLLYIKKLGLIDGIEVLYANDSIYHLDIENIMVTLEGLEFLKKLNDEINKNILEILYENRFKKTLMVARIKKTVFIHLKNYEIEAYLKILKDKGYVTVENKKIPEMKTRTIARVVPEEEPYRITNKGIKLVENDFKEEQKSYEPQTTFNINGGIVNFGTINNLNYIEELKAAIPQTDIREEIERYFEEIKSVTAEEYINKGKLSSIFKKISGKLAEKGLDMVTDKVLEISWMFTMAQIMQ